MIDRRAQRDSSISIFRIIAVACAIYVLVYFIFALVTGIEPIATVIACALLCIFLCIFIFLTLNPDSVRSQYTEETLSVASAMLEDIKGGLTQESARLVCRRILPETRAMTVAITDEDNVLACAGEFEEKLLPDTPIHTLATRYVIEHGIVQSFNRMVDVVGSDGSHNQVPAGIIAPIKVGDRTVGTLKFYYKTPRAVDRTQYALASGFAEILSTQLAIHELEVQKELTARAEVRALQAQINPHFLFNTLNTIASFTRTDPLRARELLREFSSFYRATLDNSGSLIPVSREVAQTRRYLTFEKARFGEDRVLATFDVSEDVEDTLVPAFVIQPIVENAVRHGMGDDDALRIDVTVHQDGEDAILIAVAEMAWAWMRVPPPDCLTSVLPVPTPALPRVAAPVWPCTIFRSASIAFMGRTPIRVSNRRRARAPKCSFILICQRASSTFKSKIKGYGLNVMRRMPGVVS